MLESIVADRPKCRRADVMRATEKIIEIVTFEKMPSLLELFSEIRRTAEDPSLENLQTAPFEKCCKKLKYYACILGKDEYKI